MRALPFAQPGRFYRGNLHTHSTRSDGTLEPEAVVGLYRDAGYDFLSLTDHFLPGERFGKDGVAFIDVTDTTAFDSDGFVTIPGAEIHGPALRNGEPWHFVVVGLPLDFPRPNDAETGPEVARRAHEAGAFVSVAHPAWYALTLEDVRPVLPVCHAIETYNHACLGVDRADGWYFLDELLGEGARLTAVAADDAHFKHPLGLTRDALGGWVHVRSESLAPDALLAALKAGAFYSSTGPELRDVRFEGDELVVTSSPVETILITSRGAKSQRRVEPGVTTARFPIAEWRELGFVRVTIRDDRGGRAWTNPIWFEG
jgi:hypothetical protein